MRKNGFTTFSLHERGFTLAEIIVVMAITAIVGTILVVIFTNTLRGSNKAQILAVIKQNGQSVLENMDKTIRSADSIVCTSLPGDTLVIVKNGTYIRYKFTAPISGTNGMIQQDNPVSGDDIKLFVDNVCSEPLDIPNTLTDTNTQSGVSVECPAADCSTNPPPIFTRNKFPGFRDQVTVSFNLRPGIAAPSLIRGQIDPVSFQTTIGLR